MIALSRRIVLAIGSMILGWACASAIFTGWIYALQHDLRDVGVTLFYTAIFAAAGWVISFLPLVVFVSPRAPLWTSRRLPWIGAVVGFVVFYALIGRVFVKEVWGGLGSWIELAPYATHPIVTGAVAGFVYSILLRKHSESRRELAPES